MSTTVKRGTSPLAYLALIGFGIVASLVSLVHEAKPHAAPGRGAEDPACVQLGQKRAVYRSVIEHPGTWSQSDDPQRFNQTRDEARRSLEYVEQQMRGANCLM